MKQAMIDFKDTVNELMSVCKSEVERAAAGEEMNEKELELMRLSLRVINASLDLVDKQVDELIEMDNKLNVNDPIVSRNLHSPL